MNKKRALTVRDMETLGELIVACNGRQKFGMDGAAPLDFGGSNGSHHGATATKLVRHGLAEHKKRGYDWGQAPGPGCGYRGSKVYRPTSAGREAFAAWWQARRRATK